MRASDAEFDIFVIGGGVNGCGIARDAAGRGLKVCVAEMNDLASATSSASTKLFHGGLRYLEYFEFRLVREALIERETLLRAMPHISWPMRFVLPYSPDMRFESATPASHLLTRIMPWMKGRRPAWLIRLGLFLYDRMARRELLPGTSSLDLLSAPEGRPLKPSFKKAFEYSDCWIEDSRLVVLNARDAEARGAEVCVRTRVLSARRNGDLWDIETLDQLTGDRKRRTARLLVNAGGPWAAEVLTGVAGANSSASLRLVRGSHLVTRRLYDHDKCYFFQGPDGRIIFTIPYETDFTLIGTTDEDHESPSTTPTCTDKERDYLLAFASRYFRTPLSADDVVWSYSGVRPLYDDGADNASAATRDYVLAVDADGGAPLLSVFGGKITTYRKLAEAALQKIAEYLPETGKPWTAGAPLPGGDFPVGDVDALIGDLRSRYPFLDERWARRLARAYGTEAEEVLGNAKSPADLGPCFGANLTEREVNWLVDKEFACTAEDIVWRRSKLGLRMSTQEIEALDQYSRELVASGRAQR